ncbi:MAG TPA: hypothetical protein VGM89_15620 [Puia sp.]|jgi:hypothetical protein
MRDAWQHLKDHSKERNIFFDLTLEQFAEFCVEYEYIQNTGNSKLSYCVDRVIEELGYTVGNLQVLTRVDNTVKENKRRRLRKFLVYDWATKWATVQKSFITPINQSVI